MKDNSVDNYNKSIIEKYHEAKEIDVTRLLSQPSPANLKRLIALHIDSAATTDDKITISRFMGCADNPDLVKCIMEFDRDKLLPVRNFLIGKTSDPHPDVVEMAAIVVGFEDRPYNRFRREKPKDGMGVRQSSPPRQKDEEESDGGMNNTNTRGPLLRRSVIIVCVLLAVLTTGFIMRKNMFPTKECMQWNNDHYEVIECKGTPINALYKTTIVEYDDDLEKFRKINVTDTTAFFINGRPVVYYSKQNNVVEFFNGAALHPVSGKPLKEVTPYIINKYVYKKN